MKLQWNPYLSFNGNCSEAFDFYAKVFGGKVVMMMTYGETPAAEHVSPAARGKIMHGRLVVGDQVLMGSDATPERPYEGIKGLSVAIQMASPPDAERIFAGLSEGGKVTMPIGETFWAARFGMCIDKFGVPWMVNCENPMGK